jgi:3-dehydroquinate synthase II
MSTVKPKIIWVRSDLPERYEERKRIVASALETGFVDILIREEDQELRRLGRYDAFVVKEDEVLLDGEVVGRIVDIRSAEDASRASELKDRVEHLIIRAQDWKVIPLENLIAEFQGSKTKVLASASSPEEAKLFFETLEVGVDGIVIESASRLSEFLASPTGLAEIPLTALPVTAIRPLSSGDRVCVDTCSLLRIGEGMLVGSQSSCLFLIASESMESEYVASRPFRVNAGAVHAYILTPTGKTRYLSEIKSGDEVLAVDAKGGARNVVVGRSKIEKRPLILVEVEAEGERHATIVQNAETIRLVTEDGPVSISDLQVGDRVLVRLEEGGRHFGQAVRETIKEI